MDPYLLQKQIKDNASDLQDFCKELKDWGEQMKNEEPKKNLSKIVEVTKTKPKKKTHKIKEAKEIPTKAKNPIDYSAWDKFDVEAACAKVDKNSSDESDVSDEIDEASLNLAMQHKEKGNKYVKEKNWNEAIQCYTEAIDAYAYDPIFYANRALCFLKLENYKKAQADCTIALKLDKTYVKAYQRRAAAREKLGLLVEAKNDLLSVLELEPKNNETKQTLQILEKSLQTAEMNESQRPISKFTLSRQRKNDRVELIQTTSSDDVPIKKHIKENLEPKVQTLIQAKIDTQKKTPIWPNVQDIKMVKPIYKLPNLRLKKPLKRIEIKEVETIPELERSEVITQENVNEEVVPTDVLKKINKEEPTSSKQQPEAVQKFVYPKTAIQFCNTWFSFGNNGELKYDYLKQINGDDISTIFKESLDTKIFSDIIEILASKFIAKSQHVYTYLYGLARVKRFSTLTMFMTSKDKENLTQLLNYLKSTSEVLNEKIENLMENYNIKC